MRAKRKRCIHIGSVISDEKRAPWKRTLKRYALWNRWNDIVGPVIAAHSCPHSWQRNTLVISVLHPTWMHELQYLHEEIIRKIRAAYPTIKLNNLRFQIGNPEDFKEIAPDDDTSPPIDVAKLSRDEIEFVEDTTRPIKDDATRTSVQRLMAKDLSLKKTKR